MSIQDRFPHANIPALQAWVAKLREADRQQVRSRLATRGADGTVRQCCLDVACEVYLDAGETRVRPYWGNALSKEVVNDHTAANRWYEYIDSNGDQQRESMMLPIPVAEWFGFYEIDPDTGERFMRMNGTPYPPDQNPMVTATVDWVVGVGKTRPKTGPYSLASLNDNHKLSFAKIADAIEAELPPRGGETK